jgi:hypothetical protein
MSNEKIIIGRGTKVYVAPLPECQRVVPERLTFTVDTAAALGATVLPVDVTAQPRNGGALTQPTLPISAPFWLNFTEPNGREHFVRINEDFDPADAELTVKALKRAIPAGAIAKFPLILRNRTSANLSDSDNTADVMTFDNDGWRDQVTTMLGNGLEVPGYYSPLDAGWNTCFQARLNFGEIYWELQLPKPGCGSDYTHGHIIYGFGGVAMPIETPADNIINANITITSRGSVTFEDPE